MAKAVSDSEASYAVDEDDDDDHDDDHDDDDVDNTDSDHKDGDNCPVYTSQSKPVGNCLYCSKLVLSCVNALEPI